jgi:ABC-2 type transport system permease protein
MVAQLLQLRVDLLAGEVRAGATRSVLVVVGSLAGLAAAVLMAMGIWRLGDASPEVARALLVPVGALVALGFTVVPLAVGVGDQLDPRRYAVFGIGRKDLAVGLGVAGLVGVPTIAVAIVAVAQAAAWMRGGGIAVLGVVSAVLVVLTCALLLRVGMTIGAWLLASHRTRDAAWLVALVVVVLLIPAFSLLLRVDWLAPAGPEMQRVADIAGWTPWGAAWAAPADVASGHVGEGILKLVIALAVVGLLALAWWALVGRLLETVDGEATTRRYRNLGWFDRLGATPVGAVAARALTYWGRDPRYRTSYLIIVFVPLVVVPLGIAGVPWHWTALVPLPLMALIAGFLPHNDVAYDNTAVWLHVASGAPGWSDRLGRVTPILVVGIPALAVGSVLAAWLFGDWSVLPLVIGVSACALFCGLGLSSIVSALLPYPTVRPGDHPFQQPQSAGTLATVAQSAMVVGIVVLCVPVGWCAFPALRDGGADGSTAVVTLVVGLAVGVVVLAGGIVAGGRLFDRYGPDLLAAAQRN